MEMDELQMQLLPLVYDALDTIRRFTRKKIARGKYHEITSDEVKNLCELCRTALSILNTMNIESQSLNELYKGLCSHIFEKICRRSEFFDQKVMILLDCTEKELALYMNRKLDKRTIKVKYVDFYGGFDPCEHWVYKVLEKRYDVVFSESPDYLFFSCFDNHYLSYDCIRIFICNEAVYPNFNLYDYAITYADFTITDRLLPNRDVFENLKYRQLARSTEEAQALLKQKKEFCNFLHSNIVADDFQNELFQALKKYKSVDSRESISNHIGCQGKALEQFQSQYKFSIVCEDSCYKGYTTEKIINALNAKTIPIYWGNPDINDIIDPKAIINCHDYPNMDCIIEEILRLDQDEEAYERKLQEPILAENGMIEKYLIQREQFIYHIIEQPYADAIRRNRGLRGQWYNDYMCHILDYPNEWLPLQNENVLKRRKRWI